MTGEKVYVFLEKGVRSLEAALSFRGSRRILRQYFKTFLPRLGLGLVTSFYIQVPTISAIGALTTEQTSYLWRFYKLFKISDSNVIDFH